MRWLGRDSYGDLPFVTATLRAHGFGHEAMAADAMFGPPETAEARCLDLMQDAFQRNRRKPDLPLAVLDDRRGDGPRRAAVIVSLYNAAGKLPTLLAGLAQQSLAQRGELEVVLVDSGSPADERAAMEGFLARQPLPVVYARSAERETIQQAWNRGIGLARAPYLAFLGADEGLHPDALRQLADVLDADRGADWAMADSIVTDVDANGVYVGDVMPYDRGGYRQDLVYLETCYLSWVGGLYRRNIHDRFGFYDETYRAAGDTEFKNRILPHIRTVHVPRALGVFNNYPEARTTAHPRAEIEDLRAWYLWRTRAGMRYAFDARPADDAMALLRTALNYRKSFCGHLSSDFDLADALARYLVDRPDVPAEWSRRAAQATGEAVTTLQRLDELPRSVGGGLLGLTTARHAYAQVKAARGPMAERHRVVFDLPVRPHYEVFNDNRYEQHWWSWSGS
jgi:glycosyltransferase involved in cell wall biosynthesis